MMTKEEARDLEAQLTTSDDPATIRRVGTIKITDVVSGKSEIHATYAAADFLRLLNEGYSVAAILSILEKEEEQSFLAWCD
ncbi:MAG: hypothetical protein ACYSTI_13040 [Planctomycetota bacterium]|jgi:hypothetical protein